MVDKHDKKEEIYGILPCGIRDALEKENLDFGAVTEICIRAGKPIYVNAGGREIPDRLSAREGGAKRYIELYESLFSLCF